MISKMKRSYNNFIVLFFRSGPYVRIVNLLTLYRVFICSVLLHMVLNNNPYFKWVLLSAFLTDALDGFLARRWNASTKTGAALDSYADDWLFLTSLFSILYLHPFLFLDNFLAVIFLMIFFIVKLFILVLKHKRIVTAMHTYLTKSAALAQAIFFLYSIFVDPSPYLFYLAIFVTQIAILEEIIILFIFKDIKVNTKGLFFKSTL